jgi:hypothetical protein
VQRSPPLTSRRKLRRYCYLLASKEDRESPRLVREWVRCGKPTCRCAAGVSGRHGPYWYLRWEQFDRRSGETRCRREYVPIVELPRVRLWVRRAQADSAYGRAFLGWLRRYARGVLYRERRRARSAASQRS